MNSILHSFKVSIMNSILHSFKVSTKNSIRHAYRIQLLISTRVCHYAHKEPDRYFTLYPGLLVYANTQSSHDYVFLSRSVFYTQTESGPLLFHVSTMHSNFMHTYTLQVSTDFLLLTRSLGARVTVSSTAYQPLAPFRNLMSYCILSD